MQMTLTVPETIFKQTGSEIAHELLERVVLEAYRTGAISIGRLAEILDLSIDEALSFLKGRQIGSQLTIEDVDEGRKTLEALLSK
jgi:predicted HTH domain antitoxin